MKKRDDMSKMSEEKELNKKPDKGEDVNFGLTEEAKSYSNLNLPEEEINDTGNFLHQLHLRNHRLTSKETIHEMFRAEEEVHEIEKESYSREDELIFLEVQDALSEKDVFELRNSLHFISKNVSAHNFKFDDIEDFISGELDDEHSQKIHHEALKNSNLADEITLFREINESLGEKDILQLRNTIGQIMDYESSHSRSLTEIEEYISDELEDSKLSEFIEEFHSNFGLMEAVKLSNEINEAISEKDIMSLRDKLKNIKESQDESENWQKRGITPLRLKKTAWYAAASVVLLFGLTMTFRNNSYSNAEIYQEFYRPFEGNIGISRSATLSGESLINRALIKMNSKDYDSAFEIFSEILEKDKQNIVANFYSGTIYQMKGKYSEAIHSFTNVVQQQDNLFVEQSEWYISLCYLNQNEREKAIRQLRKIIQNKGFYQQKSKEILKKLE